MVSVDILLHYIDISVELWALCSNLLVHIDFCTFSGLFIVCYGSKFMIAVTLLLIYGIVIIFVFCSVLPNMCSRG